MFYINDNLELFVAEIINGVPNKVTVIYPDNITEIIYKNGTDIQTRLYGKSVGIWGSRNSVLLKSNDKSIHLMREGIKQWTMIFSISFPKRILQHYKGFIVSSFIF